MWGERTLEKKVTTFHWARLDALIHTEIGNALKSAGIEGGRVSRMGVKTVIIYDRSNFLGRQTGSRSN